ncbi:hypothetical protein AABB24_012689 [Solanum stoloniferum]|uniref:acetyl-CoA carboxytransferase n=1 Tax=Solanum stoloniferum TaxID=62892 RepID=A0ABD2U412_9SOLN
MLIIVSFLLLHLLTTPVIFADLRSEEIGQGEPIAPNLRAMFELRVPIITIVTNEGGSGKTLAIGCANKWLMLETQHFMLLALKLVLQYYESLHKQLQRYMRNSCSSL